MEIFHINNGMFQYFLLIDPPRKIRIQTPSIALKLHINKKSKVFDKYVSKSKEQAKITNKPTRLTRVWQFIHKKIEITPSKMRENTYEKPKKQVKFTDKPTIRPMHVWKFAHAEARKGKWHQFSIDKMHFDSKIQKLDKIISPILLKKCEKITRGS